MKSVVDALTTMANAAVFPRVNRQTLVAIAQSRRSAFSVTS